LRSTPGTPSQPRNDSRCHVLEVCWWSPVGLDQRLWVGNRNRSLVWNARYSMKPPRPALLGLPLLVLFAMSLAAQEEQTAPAPQSEATAKTMHWSMRPPVRPSVPTVREQNRVQTDVDRFIEERLEAKQLGIGPEADRATLLRRVSFDLTGLPPT